MGQIILRLDRVMADRKMSLNELSARVGVANVNLSKMKNGHISAIRFSTLAAICDVLNCQPGDILEYSPEEKGSVTRLFQKGKALLGQSQAADHRVCRLFLPERPAPQTRFFPRIPENPTSAPCQVIRRLL